MNISVIIPTYKPKSYIWECLDSICSQTYAKEEYEVILVLNGCKEPYDGQIREYISNHPEVQWNYIQTDQAGVSNARNLAMAEAKGDYVTFIDDDDYVSANYLKELLACSSADTIGYSNSFAFMDTSPKEEVHTLFKSTYDRMVVSQKGPFYKYRRAFLGPCMKLFPKQYLEGRSFDVRFKNWEDTLFLFNISDRMKYIAPSVPSAIYYRRCRKDSAVGAFYYDKRKVFAQVCRMTWAMLCVYAPRFWKYNFFYVVSCFFSTFHALFVNPSKSF